ncbi:MAG: FHA domain-containing protein [Pirellula sp.]
MIYRLHLQNQVDDLRETTWTFIPPTVLGRDASCGLCIDHESVSRKHCQFQHNSEGTLVVKDLESMNGTYVNDVRVQHRALMPGDIVQAGALRMEVIFVEDEIASIPVAPVIPRTQGSMKETQPMKKVDPLPPPPPKSWWRKLIE